MPKNAGQFFSMSNKDILSINSPRRNVRGPWLVIHKDMSKRWAIVALHWKKDGEIKDSPGLGIRWFHRTHGTPSARANATWFILPDELVDGILDKISPTPQLREKVNNILLNKYSDEELMQIRNENMKS